ncbi:MAG: GNAT family N-acetyltransferase [Anaerolineae bacterium]|nr:GNAT family N-acetyltransferase [Anaerolineae bacterium]
MNPENWQIIRYTPEYKEQVIQLQTHLWGPDLAANTAYFDWKYEQNPYQESPIMYLAVCDDMVAAFAGYSTSRWQAGDPPQIIDCLTGTDAITHPDYRRQSLFSRINERALEDLTQGPHPFIFTLSAGIITTPASHRFGWYDLAPNEIGMYVTNTRSGATGNLRQLVKKVPGIYPIYRFVRRMLSRQQENEQQGCAHVPETQFHFLDAMYSDNSGIRREAVLPIQMTRTPDIDKITTILARKTPNPKIRQVRDTTFLQWRYRNPKAGYRFLYAGNWGNAGYMVLRESVYPKRTEVQIVDWEVETLECFRNLIRCVVREGRFPALSIWTTTMSKAEKQILRDEGFTIEIEHLEGKPDSYRPVVMVRKLIEKHTPGWAFTDEFVADSHNWDIRSIYSDGY